MTKRIIAAVMALVIVSGAGTYGSGAKYITAPATANAAVDEDGNEFIIERNYGRMAYRKYTDHIVISHCTEAATSIEIPSEIEDLPVTAIGSNAFTFCRNLTELTIPDSVKKIGSAAFAHCESLPEIKLPDGITLIDSGVFYNCASLTEITIPAGVTEIGDNAFEGCSGLKSITIPDKVTSIGNGAFSSCGSLTEITIPDSVTEIGASAFKGCSKLPGIKLPDSITSIEDKTFLWCTDLNNVVIPDSVTSIGSEAFSCCDNLTDITIPNSVVSIGDKVFAYSTSLAGIKLPNGIPKIGEQVFYKCSALRSIILPESVSSIGKEAFGYCNSLEKITITNPNCEIFNTKNTIANSYSDYDGAVCGYKNSTAQAYAEEFGRTFEVLPVDKAEGAYESLTYKKYDDHIAITSCDKLAETVEIPAEIEGLPVTVIGELAFSLCKKLKTVTIPDSVTEIQGGAFRGCSKLEKITIPDSVRSIGTGAFELCGSLKEITILNPDCRLGDHPGTISNGADAAHYGYYFDGTICGHHNSSVQFYADLMGYRFESLDECEEGTFEKLLYRKYADYIEIIGCYPTIGEEIVIPAEIEGLPVTSIGDSAFRGHGRITKVTLPDTVTNIGIDAFLECKNLEEINIPANLESVGGFSFEVTKWLDNKRAEDPLVIVNDIVLDAKETKGNVVIPGGVRSISSFAFFCSYATSVTIPDSVTKICMRAFDSCNHLTEITLPESVSEIDWRAFSDCSDLTEITILSPDCEIFDSSGTISNDYDMVDHVYAYYYNGVIRGHENSTAQAYAEKYGYRFKVLEDEVTEGTYESLTYKKYADHVIITGCDLSAVSVDIPAEIEGFPVTGIGATAFALHSKLVEVTIPDSVTSIGIGAFMECTALTGITIPESVARIEEHAFSDCSSLTSITLLNQDCEIYNTMYTISNSHSEEGGATYKGVIRGYPSSTARSYAARWGYEFEWFTEAPEQSQLKPGDANCDGKVTVADATAILQYLGNSDAYPLSSQGKMNADVDASPGLTVNDALTIQRFLAGVIGKLPE